MIDEKGFGKRLEECMKQANFSNTRLTKELNLSKNAIGNYKNNQIPNAAILYNISQILGTTMEYLLTGKQSENLTDNEKEMLKNYRMLPEREQIKFIGKIEDVAIQYKQGQEKSLDSKIG